jgi:TonB-linked SusC/RagA family outer membrane protein
MEKKSYWFSFLLHREIKNTLLSMKVLILLGLLNVFSLNAAPFSQANSGAQANEAMQQKKISGRVTDASTGESIPGVNVVIQGTSTGVITDSDGKYTIEIPRADAILLFSYVGYNSETIKCTGLNTVDVALVPDIKSLDEVVVIGYGTAKKRDLTGSVVSIKSKDILSTPTSNAMEALQGKITGMDIIKSSGAVGSGVDITLRGVRSIYGGNDPLFIIDGLPASYNQINPNDIESIDILKDASSTAIYGSAGANGVVIITTKRGKEGKVAINFDAYYGFSGSAYFKHGMIGDEYINYQREAYRTNHGAYPEDLSQIFAQQDLDLIDQGKWIDWVGECIGGKVQQQKYNLSISAGNKSTKVFASFNVGKEKGLLSNENKDIYGIRLNLDQELASWAKIGANINVNYSNTNARSSKIFTMALSSYPLGDPYDADGNINYVYNYKSQISPLSDQIPGQYANNTKNIYVNGSTFLELTPVKGLTIRTVLGATLSSNRNGVYFGKQCISNPTTSQTAPTAGIYNTYGYGYKWDNVISYTLNVMDNHKFTIDGISSWAFDANEGNTLVNQGQALDSYSYNNLSAGSTQKVTSYYKQKQALSFAGRFIYSFKGKYLLTLTNRWDGVSRLAEGHQWDHFPSAAIAWRVSDERFMSSTSNWLSNFKIRFGWGITGNAGPLGEYDSQTGVATLQKLTIGGESVSSTLYSGMYGNASVGWEKSYNKNLGFDFGFFKDRIEFTLELYNTDTKDLLCKVQLPVTSGATGGGDSGGLNTWQNIGQTNNKGFEFSLNTRNIVTKDFQWTSSISFSRNKEKIVSLPGGDKQAENLFVGYPVKTFYDYKYSGIWSTEDETTAALYGAKPGYVKIATNPIINATDLTSDEGVHTYQASDMQKLGSADPKWYLGFSNTFMYKGFDLSVFTMVRWGQMIESDLLGWYDLKSSGVPSGSDYWTPEHQSGYYPRPGLSNSMVGMGSLKFIEGSYIKIKNITLGYTVPASLLKKFHIGSVRVYFTAYNPVIFAKESMLKGTDPENQGSDTFPLYKTYVCGVNLSF